MTVVFRLDAAWAKGSVRAPSLVRTWPFCSSSLSGLPPSAGATACSRRVRAPSAADVLDSADALDSAIGVDADRRVGRRSAVDRPDRRPEAKTAPLRTGASRGGGGQGR